MAATVPWYTLNVLMETEPIEANRITAVGKQDDNSVIGNVVLDAKSADSTQAVADRPLNYLGEYEDVYWIDLSLNTPSVVNACLNRLADRTFPAYIYYTWKGPFRPTVAIGTRWTLEGIGSVKIMTVTTGASTPKELEYTESTTYVGRLIS